MNCDSSAWLIAFETLFQIQSIGVNLDLPNFGEFLLNDTKLRMEVAKVMINAKQTVNNEEALIHAWEKTFQMSKNKE